MERSKFNIIFLNAEDFDRILHPFVEERKEIREEWYSQIDILFRDRAQSLLSHEGVDILHVNHISNERGHRILETKNIYF